MTITEWVLPRESTEWVGPIVVTKIDAETGEPVTDPVQFALLPLGTRPEDSDWASPILDPDGTGELGVSVAPVESSGFWRIWVRVEGNPEVPVLDTVGTVRRT